MPRTWSPTEPGGSGTRLRTATRRAIEESLAARPSATESCAVVGLTDAAGTLGVIPAAATPPDGLFAIGSLTKSMLAATAMTAIQRGELGLDDSVSDRVSWFVPPRVHRTPIRVRSLLTHTAGLPNGGTGSTGSPAELQLADVPAIEPGTRWWYSNLGYRLLAEVLREATGRDPARVVRERLLEPLGMSATVPLQGIEPAAQLIPGRVRADDRASGRVGPTVGTGWLPVKAPESGLASSVDDLLAFVRLLLNGGGPLIPPALFDEMVSPQVTVRPGSSYGFGLYVYSVAGRRWVGHSGSVPGYKSMIMADLDLGVGVAVLSTGIGDPVGLTRFALLALTADREGRRLPPLPEAAAPELDVEFVTGRYGCGEHSLVIRPFEGGVQAAIDGTPAAVEARGRRAIFVDHDLTRPFLLQASGTTDGPARELRHGFSTWTREGVEPSSQPPSPFVGSYEAFNPWLSNLHVVTRSDGLHLIRARGLEEPLCVTDDPLTFRIGADDCPDYLRFEPPVPFRGGTHQALVVDLCGAVYCRVG